MHHWDRNTTDRLERSSSPQEQGCEVSIHSGQMEPPLKEHQSHQGVHRNLNVYRSMRDHIHLPRISAPSCIMPPSEDIVIKPYIVPILPTFHGMESENPYSHIREFEEVCNTFKEDISNVDLMRLILMKAVSSNRKDWSLKLLNLLWAYRTTYKTILGMSPYHLVYGKACHLPMEIEYKAWWAVKKLNLDMGRAGLKRLLYINELEELRNDAYVNSKIAKDRLKKWHDQLIARKNFKQGD